MVSTGTGRPREPARGEPAGDGCACWRPSIRWCGTARRFELLWGWVYRFEAYTPASKRKLGYYALPLLWRDRVIGWGNLSVKNGELHADDRLRRIAPPARSRLHARARGGAGSHASVSGHRMLSVCLKRRVPSDQLRAVDGED